MKILGGIRMSNRVVLITGASKGIGKATAMAFLAQGDTVIVNYNSDAKGAQEVCDKAAELGLDSMMVQADLTKMEDIKRMFAEVFAKYETIDILVNNAGISHEKYFLDTDEADFELVNSLDWRGTYFSALYTAKNMIAHDKKGLIINVSSNQAVGCWPRAAIYAPVKAAVTKFTQNAAMELAPHGIRMVGIAPGYTDTGWPADSHLHDAKKLLPLKSFATPEDIGESIVFLASPAAKYMTGSVLTIDGGATLPVVACNDFV